ncbi:hypothetical protein HBB16_08615 [Pseudonocardia sp. MCCB 268]|nr:hypothetical protein [Pseudonocardia cytotoxica]
MPSGSAADLWSIRPLLAALVDDTSPCSRGPSHWRRRGRVALPRRPRRSLRRPVGRLVRSGLPTARRGHRNWPGLRRAGWPSSPWS